MSPVSASPQRRPVASSAIARSAASSSARTREPLPPRSSSTGKRERDPQPIEVVAGRDQGAGRGEAGDHAPLVVDRPEAADDVAVDLRARRPRGGDRVDVREEGERGVLGGADHEAVAAGLAAHPPHGQRPVGAQRLDPVDDPALGPRLRRDPDQLGEQVAGLGDGGGIGAHPLCTSCQARTQVWKLSGWTSAIASAIERGSAVSRKRAGTAATAAALTTAKPFWAAIACAGLETK